MNLLWPMSPGSAVTAIPDADIEALYYYPERIARPYVRLNYICTANGKVSVDGRSAGLGALGDKLVFRRLRRLADVVLVGAGTVRAEGYRGTRSSESLRTERRRRGQAEVAPIAVVTASADLDVGSPFFTDTLVPPIVLTVSWAPPANVARLAAAGAEVILVGEKNAEVEQILSALASRGLYRILCEGGPILFGDLIAADAVDEVCMTLAPKLGGAGQVSVGSAALRAMRTESVLAQDDLLLIRYRRKV
jgi:riboflavin biosynthesis pyrimidine reductase